MNLLEERLRDGLQDLASDARVNVRASDVLTRTRLREQQRHTRRLVAAAAAVVAASLLGWVTLVPRPITVQPAPLAVPSVAPGMVTAVFGLPKGTTETERMITVRVDTTADAMTVEVTEESPGRPDAVRSYAGERGRYFSAQVHDRLDVAVIPDAVRSLTIAREPWGQLRQWTDNRVGITVAATWRFVPEGGAPALVWLGSDDLVRTAPDTAVPSIALSIDTATLTIYRDARHEAWGVLDPRIGYPQPMIMGRPEGTEVRVLGPGLSGRASIGMLPSGATAVTITPTEDARWTVGTMPDGTTWYFVLTNREVWSDHSQHRVVKSIGYTERNGKRVTYTPRLSG